MVCCFFLLYKLTSVVVTKLIRKYGCSNTISYIHGVHVLSTNICSMYTEVLGIASVGG